MGITNWHNPARDLKDIIEAYSGGMITREEARQQMGITPEIEKILLEACEKEQALKEKKKLTREDMLEWE
jgi:hypothetical protein